MKIKHDKKTDTLLLHIEDEDPYDVTDDNGVDVYLTYEQVVDITMKAAEMRCKGLLK